MNDYSKHTAGEDEETGDDEYLPAIARPQLDLVKLPGSQWDSLKIIGWLMILAGGGWFWYLVLTWLLA